MNLTLLTNAVDCVNNLEDSHDLATFHTSLTDSVSQSQSSPLNINNNAKSNKLHDQIFWYKAQTHGPFKLGAKEFWEMSKDIHSDDEEEQYDPSSIKRKGQGPKIQVKKNKW